MTKIFIFGASTAYGVGSSSGSWGDLLKVRFHSHMYSGTSDQKKFEVYNFAKPGAPVEFVARTFPEQISQYRDDSEVIALVLVGGNNAKAKDNPDNYVSTPTEFHTSLSQVLLNLKQVASEVICVGLTPVDETKTAPKISSTGDGNVYFFNSRMSEFNQIIDQVCAEQHLPFVNVIGSMDLVKWQQQYLSTDGLHPNAAGQKLIFDLVWLELEKLITNN